MAVSNQPVDHDAPPIVVCAGPDDLRTISAVCASACRYDMSEVLFTLYVDKRTRQVQGLAIPRQTASVAHCDAMPGEDIRIAAEAAEHGWAVYKAHSHGKMPTFVSIDDYECGTSLHATCAANAVEHRTELPVHVEGPHVYIGKGRSIVATWEQDAVPTAAVRAYLCRTIGEAAFFTFNERGDDPCGVGLRIVTHALTERVTEQIVDAEFEVHDDLPPRLAHWTQERIDQEIDAKLCHSDGELHSVRTNGWYAPTSPPRQSPVVSGSLAQSDASQISVALDSDRQSRTVLVLPAGTFQQALNQALEYDDTRVLKRLADRLVEMTTAQQPSRTAEKPRD